MNKIYIINLILSISDLILTVIILFLTIKLIRVHEKQKESNKENTFNADDYLISLEFNVLLDKHITPLLGKMSNDEIVNVVSQSIIKDAPQASKINNKTLKQYIKETLSSYNNTYIDHKINEPIIDEEVYDDKQPINRNDKSMVDLKNTFFNFYNNDMQ